MSSSLLEAFIKVAPLLPELFAQDAAVAVNDTEKLLVYRRIGFFLKGER
jgi:hypothetical protein